VAVGLDKPLRRPVGRPRGSVRPKGSYGSGRAAKKKAKPVAALAIATAPAQPVAASEPPPFEIGVCTIIGKRGCGKSTEQLTLCRGLTRLIAFDPLGQYKDHSEFEAVFHRPLELREFVGQRLKKPFRVLYVPKDSSVIKHWRQVGVIAYAAGDMTVAIDEIGMLCQNGQLIQDSKDDEPILYKMIHFGRHRNVQVVATAQRPVDLALRYRALSTEFRIFKTTEKKDLDYLSERIGKSATDLLPNLPDYAYVYWKDDGTILVIQR